MAEHPMYAKMNFEKVGYKEYPKWITDPSGKAVIVQNQREELAILATVPHTHSPDPRDEENNALAQQLNVEMAKSAAAEAEVARLSAMLDGLQGAGRRVDEVELPKTPAAVAAPSKK
jgi:hypothetical protein